MIQKNNEITKHEPLHAARVAKAQARRATRERLSAAKAKVSGKEALGEKASSFALTEGYALKEHKTKEYTQGRLLSGVVVSIKMEQTAVVLIHRLSRDTKYKKIYRVSKKYKVHNPGNTYQEGDEVVIRESRPISKDKKWVIVKRVSEGK